MRQLLDESDSGAGARVVIPGTMLNLTTRWVLLLLLLLRVIGVASCF